MGKMRVCSKRSTGYLICTIYYFFSISPLHPLSFLLLHRFSYLYKGKVDSNGWGILIIRIERESDKILVTKILHTPPPDVINELDY